MKLNNRGFAISTMMYMILILAITLTATFLIILNGRSKVLNNLRNKVQNEINDTGNVDNYICVGNNTSENFQVGDKYTCSVSNTEEYDFYVISSDSASVNLVMSEALTFGKGNYGADYDVKTESKVAYITETDYSVSNVYKPITALKVLKRITDNWFYLDDRTDTVNDIDYTGYKARLIALSDINNYVSEDKLTIDFIPDTLTSTISSDNNIYSISDNKLINNTTVTDEYKVVPIITVGVDKIKN